MPRSAKRFIPALVAVTVWAGLVAAQVTERMHPAAPHAGRSRRRLWISGALIAAAAAIALVTAAIENGWIDLRREPSPAVAALIDVDAGQAPALMIRYGCAGCHEIPGVPGAKGQVGPPLRGLADRVYIGGALTNGSANLVRWLINPRGVDERSAMPVTGISEAEARIVAAYLLSKR